MLKVEQTIYLAFSLVVLIIFLFLRDWRTTLIPVITIPISLIGTFFVMYAAGFSINVLTMLGIVLAIGLVVDDAIVVLENIYTKIESGKSPVDSSMKGAKEIFFAVVSTTVALASVFLPGHFFTRTYRTIIQGVWDSCRISGHYLLFCGAELDTDAVFSDIKEKGKAQCILQSYRTIFYLAKPKVCYCIGQLYAKEMAGFCHHLCIGNRYILFYESNPF